MRGESQNDAMHRYDQRHAPAFSAGLRSRTIAHFRRLVCAAVVPPKKQKKQGKESEIKWFDTEPSEPNATEILFFSILLVMANADATLLHDWVTRVCNEADTALEQQSRWNPKESWGMLPSKVSKLYAPLKFAYERSWEDADLNRIGAALQAVNLCGSIDNLRMIQLGGENAFGNSAQAHLDTVGLDATNDRLAESVFGVYSYVLLRNPNLSLEAASAIAQAIRAKSFAPGGYFRSLPEHEQRAIVEVARKTVRQLRKDDLLDHKVLDEYHAQKRKTNSQLELEALVKQYALALSFFDRWKSQGVEFYDASGHYVPDLRLASMSNQEKLDWLREQIEMRVIGLGFVEFKTPWSSSADDTVGTVEDLSILLKEILGYENSMRIDGELPTAAAVPIMKRKSFKELGTPTVQANELAGTIKELSAAELLEKAQQRRRELEEAGEIDCVGDLQRKGVEGAPPFDDSLVGKWLEIRWTYWRKVTEEEKAAGEKRSRIGVPIWCEGEVVQIANGTTDKESARCKNKLAKNAVRIRWPKDDARKEPESFVWSILKPEDWNREVRLGWRYTAAQLEKERAAAGPPGKRQKA